MLCATCSAQECGNPVYISGCRNHGVEAHLSVTPSRKSSPAKLGGIMNACSKVQSSLFIRAPEVLEVCRFPVVIVCWSELSAVLGTLGDDISRGMASHITFLKNFHARVRSSPSRFSNHVRGLVMHGMWSPQISKAQLDLRSRNRGSVAAGKLDAPRRKETRRTQAHSLCGDDAHK